MNNGCEQPTYKLQCVFPGNGVGVTLAFFEAEILGICIKDYDGYIMSVIHFREWNQNQNSLMLTSGC